MDKCNKCQRVHSYSEWYDAYYCESCDIWLESKCKDKVCGFCSERPDKPSQVKKHSL